MKKQVSNSRRSFLKTSAATTAGLAIIGPGMKKASAATINTQTINLSTTPINTDIDNLRVASITDSKMMTKVQYGQFVDFNGKSAAPIVDYAVVKANMDRLACALAAKTTPAEAWGTIFKIPATKTWATAKAAIKVNGFAGMHPAVPIVAKVCEVLIGKGMLPANISIMESGPYGDFMGAGKQIPNGVATNNNKGDTLSFPDKTTSSCASALSDADIAVDIAVNKGHDRYDEFSGVTMCLKNHFWTIDCGHQGATNSLPKLVRNNSCDHLIGKIVAGNAASYPAKQQLCIVDSLWLGNTGDWTGGVSNANNANTISMCTFAGAIDYFSTMKIRSTKLSGWNQPIVDRFITEFGYAASAKTTVMTQKTPYTSPGAGWVDAGAVPVMNSNHHENPNLSQAGIVQFSIVGSGVNPLHSTLNLSAGETVRSAAIYDLKGKKIRTLDVRSGSLKVEWNGRTDGGVMAHAGSYVIRIKGERTSTSGMVIFGK
jgi:hypothetical protein